MSLVTGSGQSIEGFDEFQRLTAAFSCDACHALSIGMNDEDIYQRGDIEQMLSFEVQRWLPSEVVHRDFPDAPEHIAAAASETFACQGIGAYRAAAAVARAVVEATAKDKGISDGSLAAKIDKLAERGLIRADIRLAAHEVRHLGNAMAHGDFTDPVEEDESLQVLELMAQILGEVYESPARIERITQARLAKKP